MNIFTKYEQINKTQWGELVQCSNTATWFQTQEAYEFYASLPELFYPFVVAIAPSDTPKGGEKLRGVVVGYVTREKNALKQFATRRAIIIGGPLLADDAQDEEVVVLLNGVKRLLCAKEKGILERPIYIETRNFHDYSRWRRAFEHCGWKYEVHLNFQVDCTNWENVEENIGKHRKKYIRLSLRDGATMVENATIEQVKEYYELLQELYETKVKMPLQPWEFFEKLYTMSSCKFLLIEFGGKIVGGSICMLLQDKGVYEWFACGNDGTYKNIHPSSVTKYAGMKYAAENGYPIFDMMGAGKPNEPYGVRDFKAEFGGKLVEFGRFVKLCKPMLFVMGKLGVKILKRI